MQKEGILTTFPLAYKLKNIKLFVKVFKYYDNGPQWLLSSYKVQEIPQTSMYEYIYLLQKIKLNSFVKKSSCMFFFNGMLSGVDVSKRIEFTSV